MSARETVLRLARPEEAAAIAAVLAQAFEPFRPLYTAGGYAATTPGAGVIAARFAEGPLWVAEAAGQVVATVSVVVKGEALYLRSLAVAPAARGQGLGARLVRQAEDYARAQGLARLCLSTTPFLADAIRLYERMGFERSADGPHELAGTPLFTLVKILR